MKIFVTGGTGFIGSHFISVALAAGHEVLALRRGSREPRIALEGRPQWIEGSLAAIERSHFAGVDVFVHLAAHGVIPDEKSWQTCYDVNVMQSLASIRLAVAAGVQKFIMCGSCFEYGLTANFYDRIPPSAPLRPIDAYGASKAAATIGAVALAAELGLNLQVLRPFHVFGEGEDERRFWPSLVKAALSGADFKMTEGAQIRDFISVEDVAQQFLKAAESSADLNGPPLVRNIGTGIPCSLKDFALEWWNKFNATGHIVFGAQRYRPNEIMRYVPDTSVNFEYALE